MESSNNRSSRKSPNTNEYPEYYSKSFELLIVGLDFVKIGLGCALIRFIFTNFFWTQLVTQTWKFSERSLFVFGSFIIHEVMYFGLNGLLLFLQMKQKFQKFRVERAPINQTTDPELIKRTLKRGIVSHLLQIPIFYVLYPLFEFCGMQINSPLPSFQTVFWQIIVCAFLNDAGFYFTHRWLHSPSLYKIHKQHHEYHATIGFAAEYAHPFEQLLSNHLPFVIGPLLLGLHLWTWWIWLVWRLWKTYMAHSGYSFPSLLPPPFWTDTNVEFHDFHHTHNKGNYGVSPLWDILLDTNKDFILYLDSKKIK